jgi:hypothetical protein
MSDAGPAAIPPQPWTATFQSHAVQNTASVGLGSAAAITIVTYILTPHHPMPPPPEVIAAAIGAAAPTVHLVWRGVSNRLETWADRSATRAAAKTAAVPQPVAPIPAAAGPAPSTATAPQPVVPAPAGPTPAQPGPQGAPQ